MPYFPVKYFIDRNVLLTFYRRKIHVLIKCNLAGGIPSTYHFIILGT